MFTNTILWLNYKPICLNDTEQNIIFACDVIWVMTFFPQYAVGDFVL